MRIYLYTFPYIRTLANILLLNLGALNGTLSGAGAIVGALMIGFFVLDGTRFRRRTRGFLGLAFVTIVITIVWSCALAWQVKFDRTSRTKLHYTEKAYHSKGALFFFCMSVLLGTVRSQADQTPDKRAVYFGDAAYQALAYWIMGAISNDPFTLARMTGFYKAIQSAGGAGSFGMDATSTPLLNELLASWLTMMASFPLAGIVIWGIKDTSYTEEKTVYAKDMVDEKGRRPTDDELEVGREDEK